MRKSIFLLCLLCTGLWLSAQDKGADRSPMFGVFGGGINYQGDLQPTSFSLKHAKPLTGFWLRQPLSKRLSVKAGVSRGTISANDAYNRDYLQRRNLNFTSRVSEAFVALDYNVFNLAHARLTPFVNGGLVLFHFNPYTHDAAGRRYYLQPLGTEGQGLADYPDRKPYNLTQWALSFGGGFRYRLNNNIIISLEAVQRKTFTDYLDDVSKSYVSKEVLLAGRGPKAAELAYRGGELHNGSPYPTEGEQRGTPTEMDWYYYTGIGIEVKLSALSNLFNGGVNVLRKNRTTDWYNKRCPRVR